VKEKRSVLERIREFRGKVDLYHESGDFIVRTARNGAELRKVLQLRHDIFVREWQGRETYHGLDVDNFDFSGDHLMIIDKKTDEAVGTYRLLCSRFTDRFYSQNEFHLDEFLRWPVTQLELGRACVHPRYRDGGTIDLLWKGLSRYIQHVDARYLFGCASLKSTDPLTISSVYREFRRKEVWKNDFNIRAMPKYHFRRFDPEAATPLNPREVRDLMPSLLRSYLHAGAFVFGEPALDKEFACVDIFTVLDMHLLNPKFRQRFFQEG
jgi:putative hemolysin